MKNPQTNSIAVFSKTLPSTPVLKPLQPLTPSPALNFSDNPDSKLFNGWFSNNTTNFCR